MNRKEAWKYYKTWMTEKTISPVLGEVLITRKGWDHITRGRYEKRRRSDEHNRLNLLSYAKKIIKEVDEFTSKPRYGVEYYELKRQISIKESNKHKKRIIKVLLKKNKLGKFYFYSVMKGKK